MSTSCRTAQILNKFVFAGQGRKPASQLKTINYKEANYLNKNHKVELPIFSIHGNHD